MKMVMNIVFSFSQIWSGVKEHRTTLLSLVRLRPNDAVSFNVFKYGIQAILLAKGKNKGKGFVSEKCPTGALGYRC